MNPAYHLLTAGSLVLLLGACAANPPSRTALPCR